MVTERKIDELCEKIRPEVEKLMIEEFPFAADENGNYQPFMGSCHSFWAHEKQILKERYNIDWKTPAEEHPYIQYD